MLLLSKPLRLLTQAGLLFTLLAGKEIAARKRALLALYVCGLLAGLAVIRYDPRFLIVILPALAFCAVYFVWAIVPRQFSVGRITLPVSTVVLIALLASSATVPLNFFRKAPGPDSNVLAVTNVLHASGMQSANEVLSSGIIFHDASVPARTRYAQSYWVVPDMNSLEELRTLAQERGYHFVLYDAETGLSAHPGLERLLNPNSRPPGLTPLLVPEDRAYVLYRVESDPPRPMHSLNVNLDDGITLLGYDLYVTRDAPEMAVPRVGVFLYWRAAQPLSNSYKVFVHVLDSDGQLAAQDDGVPALWTYPTNAWQRDEIVVDFHSIALPTDLLSGACMVQAGMYDEQTMQRLSVLSAVGAPADDKVTLAQLTVDQSEIEGRYEQ